MSDHDHGGEPIRGLPEKIPAGERLLWQGTPDPLALARRAFHVNKVAIYFGLLAVWRVAADLYDGMGAVEALKGAVWLGVAGLLAVAILGLLAWMNARATVYTITDRRVAMRFGLALPITVNLPFSRIEAADLKTFTGGGDISLQLTDDNKISWVILWPHARPWKAARPEPTLRCVADAARAAETLARALAAFADQPRATLGEPTRRHAGELARAAGPAWAGAAR